MKNPLKSKGSGANWDWKAESKANEKLSKMPREKYNEFIRKEQRAQGILPQNTQTANTSESGSQSKSPSPYELQMQKWNFEAEEKRKKQLNPLYRIKEYSYFPERSSEPSKYEGWAAYQDMSLMDSSQKAYEIYKKQFMADRDARAKREAAAALAIEEARKRGQYAEYDPYSQTLVIRNKDGSYSAQSPTGGSAGGLQAWEELSAAGMILV
jgi:hypothetical protein